MGMSAAALDQRKLDHASEVLHALSHSIRLQLVSYMSARGEATVVELQDALGLEASVISNHLRVLRQARIVDTERQGKFINFLIDSDRLDSIGVAIARFSESFEEVEV